MMDDILHAVEDFLNGQERDFFKSGIEAIKFLWKCTSTEKIYDKMQYISAKSQIFTYEAQNLPISPRCTLSLSLSYISKTGYLMTKPK